MSIRIYTVLYGVYTMSLGNYTMSIRIHTMLYGVCTMSLSNYTMLHGVFAMSYSNYGISPPLSSKDLSLNSKPIKNLNFSHK